MNEVLLPRSEYGDFDYESFQRRVQALTGLRLADYKPDQMRRRIAAMSSAADCGSFVEYYLAMERDPVLLAQFLDNVTISVTELLRDPAHFDGLRTCVLPSLIEQAGDRPLTVWSAGCSYGAEAYTLAMLLHELSPNASHRVEATDLNLGSLRRAEGARFYDKDIANISQERRARFFHDSGSGFTSPSEQLRRMVTFRRHDLLSDPYPQECYDLILCRNVLIYFTDAAKQRTFRGFYKALRPGGALFVGTAERVPDRYEMTYELIRPFIYRKPFRS
jgi:chemotaxis protein methyltransferase CheR